VSARVTWPDPHFIKRLAHYIKHVDKVLVITGAGVSTEAGVPDFRSATGLWQQQLEELGTPEGLRDRFDEFTAFYQGRIRQLQSVKPGRTHEILAEWQRRGIVDAIITQNVDGLHQRAGSHVVAMHGDIMAIACDKCLTPCSVDEYFASPRCACGSSRRPGVVLFGEVIPDEKWREASRLTSEADTILVLGSSLAVAPVNLLPGMARSAVCSILINREPTRVDEAFDWTIHAEVGEVLETLDAALKQF
jgi:NAD-dependent deacetylase